MQIARLVLLLSLEIRAGSLRQQLARFPSETKGKATLDWISEGSVLGQMDSGSRLGVRDRSKLPRSQLPFSMLLF